MRSRRSLPTIVVLLAVLAAVSGLLSNVVASDIWNRIHSQPWYSPTGTGLLLCLIVAVSIALLVHQDRTAKTKEETATGALSRLDLTTIRSGLLTNLETEWVNGRLHQGLRNAIRIDLKLTETLTAVRPMPRIHMIAESGPPVERSVHDPIGDIFRAANGSLLILGDPGTGKTNLLMELAEHLIADARIDQTSPIPLVLSLPRWTLGNRPRTLADWLIDDLADVAQYSLSRATAAALVRQNLITPLLDGLDEVAAERRAECVAAIRAYQQERDLPKLAICCRIAEYESLQVRLDLRTAIRVEKLTRVEVDRYVSLDRMGRVRQMLQHDSELLTIIDTPLWLHVAMLAAEVPASTESEAMPPRQRLYTRFVRYALGREAEGSPRKQTPDKDFTHYLGWLAARTRQRNQSQFSLEQLDYSWLLRQRRARLLRGLIDCLVTGLVLGLVCGMFFGLGGGLVFGLVFGLLWGLVLGLVVGLLVFGLGSGLPIEELYFDWQHWRQALLIGLLWGLGPGLGGGLVGGLAKGLVYALVVGLVAGLQTILQPKLSAKSLPNYGTLRSLRYAGIVLLAGATLGATVAFALPSADLRERLMLTISLGVAVLAFSKGGEFAINHYIVRLLLCRFKVAPSRYVRFLNEAVDRLFLTSRGGSYEFFHVTFRDFIADAYGPPELSEANIRQKPNV